MAYKTYTGFAMVEPPPNTQVAPRKVSPSIRELPPPLVVSERNFKGLKLKDDTFFLIIDQYQRTRALKIFDNEGMKAIGEISEIYRWLKMFPNVERVEINASALIPSPEDDVQKKLGGIVITNPKHPSDATSNNSSEIVLKSWLYSLTATPLRSTRLSMSF